MSKSPKKSSFLLLTLTTQYFIKDDVVFNDMEKLTGSRLHTDEDNKLVIKMNPLSFLYFTTTNIRLYHAPIKYPPLSCKLYKPIISERVH